MVFILSRMIPSQRPLKRFFGCFFIFFELFFGRWSRRRPFPGYSVARKIWIRTWINYPIPSLVNPPAAKWPRGVVAALRRALLPERPAAGAQQAGAGGDGVF